MSLNEARRLQTKIAQTSKEAKLQSKIPDSKGQLLWCMPHRTQRSVTSCHDEGILFPACVQAPQPSSGGAGLECGTRQSLAHADADIVEADSIHHQDRRGNHTGWFIKPNLACEALGLDPTNVHSLCLDFLENAPNRTGSR